MATSLADFDILRKLGDGSFAQVVLARHRGTNKEYALKIVDKYLVLRHKHVESVKLERKLLDRLDDAGIVKLQFTFQDDTSLYFGLDVCPNGVSSSSCQDLCSTLTSQMAGRRAVRPNKAAKAVATDLDKILCG